MPIKGKGKISKQTNKLESIDSIAAAFNIGLLAAEPFFNLCSFNEFRTKEIQTNQEMRGILNTPYLQLLLKREVKADLEA